MRSSSDLSTRRQLFFWDCFDGMPTNSAMRMAIEQALKSTNEGHQTTVATEAIFKSGDTAADSSKRMRGTLVKGFASGATFYWFVPTTGDVVTKSSASAEHKLSIVKAGSASAFVKLSKMTGVTHGIVGVLTTLAPASTAGAMTELTLSVGGSAGVPKPVEEALKAAGLMWSPWAGCTAAEALVPVGAGLPPVAAARAMTTSSEVIVGPDGFQAQAALAAMGVASAGSPTTVGNVAALAASWAGHPDAAAAVSALKGSKPDPAVADRRTAASQGTRQVLAPMRAALVSMSTQAHTCTCACAC